ncbi:MAG: ribonuclease HI family protein [Candidatus Bathyarchaeota archaeon]|jgi:ribonuclease HI
MHLKIYSDGASRGNPGPSAIAFIILDEYGEILTKKAKYVGVKTNNQAEYLALSSALDSASKISTEKVTCCLDSKLVVNQLNGEYKVKDHKLMILWKKLDKFKERFQKTVFIYVPRTDRYIKMVDLLANQTLDTI